MTDEYAPTNTGLVSTPLAASPVLPTLAECDPAISAILDFVADVLDVHLGDRFAAVAAAVKPQLLTSAGGPIPVVSTKIPYDPAPFMQMAQYEPPILACYRESETPTEHTRQQYRTTAAMTLQWILPPLVPGQALDVLPFQAAAAKVLLARIEQGRDPEVANGALFCETGGIAEIAIRETRYGRLEVARAGAGQQTTLFFPTLDVSLDVAEQKTPNPMEDLEGIDATIKVANEAPAVTVVEVSEDL